MKPIKPIFIILLLLLNWNTGFSQVNLDEIHQEMDQLMEEYPQLQRDSLTIKVQQLIATFDKVPSDSIWFKYHKLVTSICAKRSLDSLGLKMCNQSLLVDIIKNDSFFYPTAIHGKGMFFQALDMVDSCKFYNKKSFELAKKYKQPTIIADSYFNDALYFQDEANHEAAISLLTKADSIYKEENRDDKRATTIFNIARSYYELYDDEDALRYFKKSAELAGENSNQYSLAINAIGIIYMQMDSLEHAEKYLKKESKFLRDDPIDQMQNFAAIQRVQIGQDKLLEALKTYSKAKELFLRNPSIKTNANFSSNFRASVKDGIGSYLNLEDINSAQIEFNQFEDLLAQSEFAYLMTKLDIEMQKRGTQTRKDFSRVINILDSFSLAALDSKAIEINEKYQAEQKEVDNKLLTQKNKANQAKIRNRNVLIGAILALLGALLTLFVFIRKNLNKEKMLSSLLEEKHEDLLHDNQNLLQTAAEKESQAKNLEEEIFQLSENIELLQKERQELEEKAKNGNSKKRIRQKSTVQGEIITLTGKGRPKVQLSDIIYFETRDKSIYVHLTNGQEIRQWQALSSFKQLLANHGFIQVQRYYLVNIRHITKQNNDNLTLSNGLKLTITNKFLAKTNEKLEELKNNNPIK